MKFVEFETFNAKKESIGKKALNMDNIDIIEHKDETNLSFITFGYNQHGSIGVFVKTKELIPHLSGLKNKPKKKKKNLTQNKDLQNKFGLDTKYLY